MAEETFDRIWNDPPFTVAPAPDVPVVPCGYAVQFQAWVDAAFEPVLLKPELSRINQLKVHLLDRYFQFRTVVPRRHRPPGGGSHGHRCIFAVFEDAYNELRMAELALTPVPFVVAARPAERRERHDGIVIGAVELDPEFGE